MPPTGPGIAQSELREEIGLVSEDSTPDAEISSHHGCGRKTDDVLFQSRQRDLVTDLGPVITFCSRHIQTFWLGGDTPFSGSAC